MVPIKRNTSLRLLFLCQPPVQFGFIQVRISYSLAHLNIIYSLTAEVVAWRRGLLFDERRLSPVADTASSDKSVPVWARPSRLRTSAFRNSSYSTSLNLAIITARAGNNSYRSLEMQWLQSVAIVRNDGGTKIYCTNIMCAPPVSVYSHCSSTAMRPGVWQYVIDFSHRRQAVFKYVSSPLLTLVILIQYLQNYISVFLQIRILKRSTAYLHMFSSFVKYTKDTVSRVSMVWLAVRNQLIKISFTAFSISTSHILLRDTQVA